MPFNQIGKQQAAPYRRRIDRMEKLPFAPRACFECTVSLFATKQGNQFSSLRLILWKGHGVHEVLTFRKTPAPWYLLALNMPSYRLPPGWR